MDRKKGRFARLAGLSLVAVLFFAWAVPAQAFVPIIFPPIFFHISGISGNVTNAGTSGKVPGIVVSAYDFTTSAYVSSAVTNSNGDYLLWIGAGTYELKFSDPKKVFGEQWYNNKSNWEYGDGIVVTTTVNPNKDQALQKAASIKVVVRRAGHSLTRLANQALILQQKDLSNHIQAFDGLTNGSGYETFGGLRAADVTYKESAIDPSGLFYSNDATSTWLSHVGGQTDTAYIDLGLISESKNATVTVPSSSSSVTHNVSFTVSDTATRKITGSTKMKIVAKKGSTTKTFSISKSSYPTSGSTKYRGKIKLTSKGTWTLYALWPGNSAYATTDSVTGKTVTVK
jgi:hypothetical protein